MVDLGTPLEIDETTAPPGAAADFAAKVEAARTARQASREAAEAARKAAEEHEKKIRALWKEGRHRWGEIEHEDLERLKQEAREANHMFLYDDNPEVYLEWVRKMEIVERFWKKENPANGSFWTSEALWQRLPYTDPAHALDSTDAKVAYNRWANLMSAEQRKQWEEDLRYARGIATKKGTPAAEQRRKLDELEEIMPGQELPAWAARDSASEGEAAAAYANATNGPQADQASQPKHHHNTPARLAELELLRAREREIQRAINDPHSSSYISPERRAEARAAAKAAAGHSPEVQQAYEAVKESHKATAEEAWAQEIVSGRAKATAEERKRAEAIHAVRVQRQIEAQEAEVRAREADRRRKEAELAKDLPVIKKAWEMANAQEREVMSRTEQVPDHLLKAARTALGLPATPSPEGGSSNASGGTSSDGGSSGASEPAAAPAGNGNTGEAAEGACAC